MKNSHIIAALVFLLLLSQTGISGEPSRWYLNAQSLISSSAHIHQSDCAKNLFSIIERIEHNKLSRNGQCLFKQNGQSTWEMITQEWQNNAWQDTFRDIVVYDDVHDETISIMTYEWKNGSWSNLYKMAVELDANGNATTMLMERWMTNTWIIDMKMTYTFNADGNLTSTLTQVDENSDNILEDMMRTDALYDANGFLIEEKSFLSENGVWIEMQKTTFINNAQGLPVESFLQMEMGGEYMDTGKSTFTYDAAGRLLVQTEYFTNFMSQGWVESDRTTYTYNAAGQETNRLDETWNGAGWTNEQQMTATYDGQGRQTETVYQVWNGAWVNEERHTHTFGANGKISVTLIQSWDASWKNKQRWFYNYTGAVAVNEQVQIPQSFSLKNYPNPFNTSTTIFFRLANPDHVSLRIVNVRGELVRPLMQNEYLDKGEHVYLWNGRDLLNQSASTGIYFIILSGESFQHTTRALLIK